MERLLEAKHLEHVPADDDVTTALKEAAFRHVASARACAGTDPEQTREAPIGASLPILFVRKGGFEPPRP